ncbi:MAG: tRNA lysidine(34) synthetase TilS [Rhodospirillaceae bacterium]|nr:tRNA lysidine(34) synthetase TilS [Rhodospirillaceae bacterium]
MAAIGSFETRPRLAVAVSGGADSLALCLLARDWARARGGDVTALTVDHGLRPAAAAEARQTGRWLKAAGIRHIVLVWHGAKPVANVQAQAREARYRLLTSWCRDAGVLHLLLGHHRGDQAETFLLRLDRGSGLDGLAGMARVAETPDVRLLRPLLAIAPDRPRAMLRARRQQWIEDPSNRDRRFRRAGLRAGIAEVDAGGAVDRMAATAFRLGRARLAIEDQVNTLLAAAAQIWPEGYAAIARAPLAAAPAEVGLRALSRCLVTIGGNAHSQRLDRLERLYAVAIGAAPMKTRTLAGCRVEANGAAITICREAEAAVETIDVGKRPMAVFWDGRFVLALRPGLKLRLRRLGPDGWAQIVKARPGLRDHPLPAAVRPSLPALWDLDGVVEVPHLSYGRRAVKAGSLRVDTVVFRPTHPLSVAGFGFS